MTDVPGFGQEEYVEVSLVRAYDAKVAGLTIDKRIALENYLIGALAVAMSTRPAGRELFLNALENAARFAEGDR